jgi:hypothetical protein
LIFGFNALTLRIYDAHARYKKNLSWAFHVANKIFYNSRNGAKSIYLFKIPKIINKNTGSFFE